MREDGVVLEHHANVAPGGVEVVYAPVAEEEVAALYRVEARNHSQKRRLAAAGRTEQGEKFTRADMQREIGDDRVAAVTLYGVFNVDANAHG